jgi:hypothetical protein
MDGSEACGGFAAAFALRFAGDAVPGLRRDLQPLGGDVCAALATDAVVAFGDPLQRGVDVGEARDIFFDTLQIDLAVGRALRRVVTVLQQYFTGVLGTREAAEIRLAPCAQFFVFLSQDEFETLTLFRGQGQIHDDFLRGPLTALCVVSDPDPDDKLLQPPSGRAISERSGAKAKRSKSEYTGVLPSREHEKMTFAMLAVVDE